MNPSNGSDQFPAGRALNAVALENAVLCAECDVVSDSPHDVCLVCGSRSLINICQILGGKMPKHRTELVNPQPMKITQEVVLHFPGLRRVRRRPSV